ncbi:hypothetical protein CEXT_117831 [Caerostris extrusa]|uniref:Uncharacterized protein n=1 Tax=Caerostris extrusa TaxID=172846 RepID=A0AAV4UYL7_CAEEX|nr:hypothetical protein CEXT_117831 [Caerostris extrusa]
MKLIATIENARFVREKESGKQQEREHELKQKQFGPKRNTIARVNETDGMLLKEEGLNRASTTINKASLYWEIPLGKTNGQLHRVGSRQFQGIIDNGAEITGLWKSVICYNQAGKII